ncbi:MAG: DNA methylase [Acutalibacteraceae bacterium]|nr:DNA methylase [Acutalibacteraceae bacterium]
MAEKKVYIAIDLKSFYASVEAMERGLDPLTTNLVVADPSRTEKTICLAVSPSLKSYGISGRARMFELIQQVKIANAERKMKAPKMRFEGKSYNDNELKSNPSLAIDYIIAPPRMALYIEYSTRIYNVYLKHVAPEDIHPYSIDEVFIDATAYLRVRGMTPYEFAQMLVKDVLAETGVTATAGIGTNLFLCKVAMDITAKHIPADEYGVRIASLDETTYRETLWNHRPIRDFWRVGRGISEKLEEYGMYTMGDVARCSLNNENLLYKLFGINAELLIDHAWGWEPCTIADIKSYKPSTNSISTGQVLQRPYKFEEARLIIREMADNLALDLVDKKLVTDQLVLVIGYDIENLTDENRRMMYKGEIKTDFYGRKVPKHARGTVNTSGYTSSTRLIIQAATEGFERIVDRNLLIRRINITANHIVPENTVIENPEPEQLTFFEDIEEKDRRIEKEKKELEREKRMQNAIVDIKHKYGKNAILKGMNFKEGATAKDRNRQIGGHKA